MTFGPVQLVVLGFHDPTFQGEIIAELERLRTSDAVRVIDAIAVYKDADGALEMEHLSDLSTKEAVELGTEIGALIGLRIAGEEGAAVGAARAGNEGISFFDDGDWDVLRSIPNGSASALILVEHRWAVPLRDAIARAGGYRIDDGFVSPFDLVRIGICTPEEANHLYTMEEAGARK